MLDLFERTTNEHLFESDNNLKRTIDQQIFDMAKVGDKFKELTTKDEFIKLTEKVNKLPEHVHL